MPRALVCIAGESASGKSQCFFKNKQLGIEGLPPAETFVVSIQKNELPMRGWRKHYSLFSKDNPKGNFLVSDNINVISNIIKYVNANRPDIKYLVVDDMTYLMSNMYFSQLNVKGFDKFNAIGGVIYQLFNQCLKETRDDLYIFITAHTEVVADPISGMPIAKIKTIGKLISEKYNLDGILNYLLFASSEVGGDDSDPVINKYFITQSDGSNTAKTPQGVFNTVKIPNDAAYIIKCIEDYECGDDE